MGEVFEPIQGIASALNPAGIGSVVGGGKVGKFMHKSGIPGLSKLTKNLSGSGKSAVDESGEIGAFANTLRERVAGNRPSVSEIQGRQQLDKNLSNTTSAIRSAPGLSPALKARMISRAGERTGTDIAKLSTLARAEEQTGAEANLGNVLLGREGMEVKSKESAKDRRTRLFEGGMAGVSNVLKAGG